RPYCLHLLRPIFSSTDPAPPALYPLSLHDALPISADAPIATILPLYAGSRGRRGAGLATRRWVRLAFICATLSTRASSGFALSRDRKSTRLNSSHLGISYAVFCLKKKKKKKKYNYN